MIEAGALTPGGRGAAHTAPPAQAPASPAQGAVLRACVDHAPEGLELQLREAAVQLGACGRVYVHIAGAQDGVAVRRRCRRGLAAQGAAAVDAACAALPKHASQARTHP
jgi:hypothetical protein